MKQSWAKHLKDNGKEQTLASMKNAMIAEIFLISAVKTAGLDWCIERLKQVQESEGEVEMMLDIVLSKL